jgi:hypothetical protein
MKINRLAAIATAMTLALSLPLTSGTAITPVGVFANEVIAQDVSISVSIAATPNSPNSLLITAAPGVSLKVETAGSKPRSVTTNKKGTAVVTRLIAGRTYTINSDSESITAMPVIPVTPASSLRVATTDTPGNVELTWKHADTPAQGAVKYRVTAEPLNNNQAAITGETTQQSFVLIGLDLATRYQFTVTPINALGAGKPSTAVMVSSLGEITGKPIVEPPQPVPSPQPTPAANPQPAPAPAPAPVGPSSRTIYVCPEGSTEVGNLCEKTTPYTFTTRAYSYHDETYTVSVEKPGPAYAADIAQSTGTPCPWGGTINAAGDLCLMPPVTETQTRTRQVKDAIPAGFTDNGTEWVKKNDMPAGYTDNGTEWKQITAKEARVVPA